MRSRYCALKVVHSDAQIIAYFGIIADIVLRNVCFYSQTLQVITARNKHFGDFSERITKKNLFLKSLDATAQKGRQCATKLYYHFKRDACNELAFFGWMPTGATAVKVQFSLFIFTFASSFNKFSCNKCLQTFRLCEKKNCDMGIENIINNSSSCRRREARDSRTEKPACRS